MNCEGGPWEIICKIMMRIDRDSLRLRFKLEATRMLALLVAAVEDKALAKPKH